MLGVGKAVPAQFFADMQLRIYSANAPPAKRSIGYFSSKIANDLREFGLLPLARMDASCISDFLSKYRRRFFEKFWFTRAFLS